MDARREFVMLAGYEGSNLRLLCRRFGISPTTGHKWLLRFAELGEAGLVEHSRRPHTSPRRTPAEMESAVLGVRKQHPAWGGRKIRRRLLDLGQTGVPSASTVTAILRRHGCIDADQPARQKPWQRFEHATPNALWQMDFKGHFALTRGRCHPLTVVDDHSRFAIALEACGNERGTTVQTRLTAAFRRYGLPALPSPDPGQE